MRLLYLVWEWVFPPPPPPLPKWQTTLLFVSQEDDQVWYRTGRRRPYFLVEEQQLLTMRELRQYTVPPYRQLHRCTIPSCQKALIVLALSNPFIVKEHSFHKTFVAKADSVLPRYLLQDLRCLLQLYSGFPRYRLAHQALQCTGHVFGYDDSVKDLRPPLRQLVEAQESRPEEIFPLHVQMFGQLEPLVLLELMNAWMKSPVSCPFWTLLDPTLAFPVRKRFVTQLLDTKMDAYGAYVTKLLCRHQSMSDYLVFDLLDSSRNAWRVLLQVANARFRQHHRQLLERLRDHSDDPITVLFYGWTGLPRRLRNAVVRFEADDERPRWLQKFAWGIYCVKVDSIKIRTPGTIRQGRACR